MKITRDMYPGACDPYTDLLDILTRSLGVNPMQVSLQVAINKAVDRGESGGQTIYGYRTYLEQFLHGAFTRLEEKRG